MAETLLETVDVVKSFAIRKGFLGRKQDLVAVDGVSLKINKGETLGLVGESGCGKSTLGLTIMRLYEPTSGQVLIEGDDVAALDAASLRKARGQMQMIFQDPLAALDPRLTVEDIIREPLDIHSIGTLSERTAEVKRLLRITGMPLDSASRLPNEFSGGQQQRIGIARALALRPKLLICDEPVSSLDVSVQAQILNLLRDLQKSFGLTYLFISHNIAITAFMSRRIGVMYLGKLVEIGPSQSILKKPSHPYTQALLKAIPQPDPKNKRSKRMVVGEIPSPIDRPSGCPFHTRCPLAQQICTDVVPELRELAPEHEVACHFAEEAAAIPAV
jgi:oligopeptide/dipeptide ABC transporter ATP-binding protein